MKKILFTILLFFISSSVFAARQYNEAYYQEKWCKDKGVTEYKLEDYTRVDCLTETHAIEFDFAKKWAEAIGQSLHYARMTGKQPGIVLIIEKEKDFIYFNRIKPLCEELNIMLWQMQGMEFEQ